MSVVPARCPRNKILIACLAIVRIKSVSHRYLSRESLVMNKLCGEEVLGCQAAAGSGVGPGDLCDGSRLRRTIGRHCLSAAGILESGTGPPPLANTAAAPPSPPDLLWSVASGEQGMYRTHITHGELRAFS